MTIIFDFENTHMIITTIGSMGTCKTSLVIHLYTLLMKQQDDVYTKIFTSHYNPDRNGIPKEHIKHGGSVQVLSRIMDSVVAEMITDQTNFEKRADEKRPGVLLFDEFQFTCESAVKKVIEAGKKETLHVFGLNTDYQNMMWPAIRSICIDSDFVFVVENNDLKNKKKNHEGELRNTNMMTIDGKFDLDITSQGVMDFEGCSKESWYEYATEYFAKKLTEYEGNSEKMLLENPFLKNSFTKLFRLWKLRTTEKSTNSYETMYASKIKNE